MAEQIVTIDGLSEEAKKYQKELKFLPYLTLSPELARLGINLMQVANIDVVMQFERQSGILRPYSIGQDPIEYNKIGQFSEKELKVESSYAALKDHIKNYQAKQYINPAAGTGINQTKQHPMKGLIVGSAVRTVAEDVLDSLFFGKRDVADRSPLGSFNGYETIIKAGITGGEIAAGKGNLVATGAIVAPTDDTDTDAIDKMVLMIRTAHPFMRKYGTVMMITEQVAFAASDALAIKRKAVGAIVTVKDVEAYLNSVSNSKVSIVVSHQMGTGGRIIWTAPFGNFDFGMNTFGDHEFVQVRNPYEDPNLIQFWCQADFGSRIRSFHKKLFVTNDQALTSVPLSGDYDS